MARPGRPRKHDLITDDIRRLIENFSNNKAKELLMKSGIEILDGDSSTPLIWASFCQNTEILRWLIENRAHVDHQNRNGYCALHTAAQEGHIDVVHRLLSHGANTELQDVYGNTPLWTAVFNARGNYKLVKLLIESGANPGSKNKVGKSPLKFAQQLKDEVLVRMLKKNL
jgi:ankyrin repeat protein